jgi:hypothetical protein
VDPELTHPIRLTASPIMSKTTFFITESPFNSFRHCEEERREEQERSSQ